MFIALKSRSAINKLKSQLSSEFNMKVLRDAKRLLGMEINRDRKSDKVCLTQKGYCKKYCGSSISGVIQGLLVYY